MSEHRYGEGYAGPSRRRSWAKQRALIGHPPSVLEVGPGPGRLADHLRAHDVEVTTIDIRSSVPTDVRGLVTGLPFADGAFDTVGCFQVLEHVAVDELSTAIEELVRCASHRVIVSVPEKGDKLRTWISLNVLGRAWDHPEHRWELGMFVTNEDFVARFEAAGATLRAYDDTHDWHRFFVFEVDSAVPS